MSIKLRKGTHAWVLRVGKWVICMKVFASMFGLLVALSLVPIGLCHADEAAAGSQEGSSAGGEAAVTYTDPDEMWDDYGSGIDYVPGELIVELAEGVTIDQLQKDAMALPNSIGDGLTFYIEPYSSKNFIMAKSSKWRPLREVVNALAQCKDVVGVDRNWVAGACITTSGWNRLSGATALDTMADILTRSYCGERGNVVVASAYSWWDALAACGLAGFGRGTLVLTGSDALSFQAEQALIELDPEKVYICGGYESVGLNVEQQVKDVTNCEPVRIAGETAVGTAIEVAKRDMNWSDTAIVATSATFQDALAISPYAYNKHCPIFLANRDGSLSPETLAAIGEGGFKNVVVVGGNASVSDDTVAQIAQKNTVPVTRVAGDNAALTSLAVAKMWENESERNNLGCCGFASADAWQDSLVGATVCGVMEAPLLLVSDANEQAVDWVIEEGCKFGYIFGGTASVSQAVEQRLVKAIEEAENPSWKQLVGWD